ncbi:WD40 repeat-like protein [Suillus bovinus]|uniref:WD40 repeat-like protein n=1 Tax=Suillus bovinus TaxID=48563 RepID=UPI001B87370A|nr:WD40 repeat-like protein [Suillus bovinus]KAG2159612.1 WD40 repeat-like protein [Suillus bovinus]
MLEENDDDYDGPDAYVDEEDDAVLDLEDLQDSIQERTGVAQESPMLRQILLSLFNPQNTHQTDTSDGDGNGSEPRQLRAISIQDLQRLLNSHPAESDYEEEDDDEIENVGEWHQSWFPPHKEPQQPGVELLMGGEFGSVSSNIRSRRNKRSISQMIFDQSSRPRGAISREHMTSELIPNTNGIAVASYAANVYSGQFSKDSSFYYTCCQDFRLHIYDMTSPPSPYVKRSRNIWRSATGVWDDNDRDHDTTLKILKTIQGCPGRWTITDSHLSPDNERQAIASFLPTMLTSPTVYMTSTLDSSVTQTPISFQEPNQRQRARPHWGWDDEDSFGIWSCRFSADGNEVVAGGSGQIFVYDLLADRRTVKIIAHEDDVNSCCWADTASGNVLISASDDTFLKVWDRRSLGASQKPSGVLVGHTEGITNVSAKGDGRYIISNGKDQALRLWDLRKMCSSEDFDNGASRVYRTHGFDYRYGNYPKPKRAAHPRDCSVMTYRGHAVLRTLIRCHFSPAETTGGRYIYSGSADGKIHIWSLDGRIVQVLDRSKTSAMTSDPSEVCTLPNSARSTVCVRDVSWNGNEPMMMSAGWDGGHSSSKSVVARHEWRGLSNMSYGLEDWIEKQNIERDERATRTRQTLRSGLRGASNFIRYATSSKIALSSSLYGFPPGYFVIRNLGNGRLWDVCGDDVEDSAEILLWPEKEKSLVETLRNPDANNQVFFIDTSGALCSRSSGHAIDIEGDRLVLRHRRPISQPYPNEYSHPLPRFSYSSETQQITASFQCDPAYPPPAAQNSIAWMRKTYVLSSIPMPKPKSLLDNASAFLSSAVTTPISFFSGGTAQRKATPEDVFSGDIDLTEDETLEQDRGVEGDADDSSELLRKLRVLTISQRDAPPEGESARKRRQWQILPLRTSAAHRRLLK